MHIEALNFTHQDLLESKLRNMNLLLSEYSFANLYLFRQLHQYEVITLEQEVFIRGLTRDKASFIMLTSLPENLSKQSMHAISQLADFLYPIPESWLISFQKNQMTTSFKEEDSDYLYVLSKIATYAGRHLDGKRNQVKQLLRDHEVRSEKIDAHLSDAEQVLDEWAQSHSESKDQTDYASCQEALHHFARLHLTGKIVYVDQRPAGFAIGEWISHDCYTVHFAKALRSIQGIYQYLFQDLARSLDRQEGWINFEQDLGQPPLRRSKLSYNPDQMGKKWRLRLPT